jgi:holo-[acyl-carrier protein] synthase
MKPVTGIDLVEIERMRAAIERHGERFLNRIFTPRELADCAGKVESLAARYAAKEAAAKALGTGFRGFGFIDIEIQRGPQGEPALVFLGPALILAEQQGWREWSVSMSHSQDYATAIVVALKN